MPDISDTTLSLSCTNTRDEYRRINCQGGVSFSFPAFASLLFFCVRFPERGIAVQGVFSRLVPSIRGFPTLFAGGAVVRFGRPSHNYRRPPRASMRCRSLVCSLLSISISRALIAVCRSQYAFTHTPTSQSNPKIPPAPAIQVFNCVSTLIIVHQAPAAGMLLSPRDRSPTDYESTPPDKISGSHEDYTSKTSSRH